MLENLRWNMDNLNSQLRLQTAELRLYYKGNSVIERTTWHVLLQYRKKKIRD